MYNYNRYTTMNNNTNGQAAEIMIKKVIAELGFKPKTPVTYEQVLSEIDNTNIPHFDSAMFHVENIYKTFDVPVEILLDHAFGIDCFFEAEDGTVLSLDVTVNGSTRAFNHKANVQAWTRNPRKRLGLNNHLLVVLETNKNYNTLTDDEKWQIIDEIEAAYASNKQDITIYL